MTVKVTVVVPVYNCGDGYLPALRSLRDQTMARSDFEVVFVDDGSTDSTLQSLRGDTAFDRWVRVVEAEHTGGPGRPRNVGLDHARGEFVLFMDDDDRLAPEALARLYDRAVRYDADIVLPRTAGHGRPAPREATAAPLDRGHLLTHPVLLRSMTALKLFRRSFLLEHGLRFPEGRVPLEDHLFTLQAHLLARSVSVLHDYTCYHWVRPEDPGPPPHAGTGLADHCRSVAAILDVIRRHVPPGPDQDRLVARWYQVKVLSRLDERILGQRDDALRRTHRTLLDLVEQCIPPAVDEYLPANLRVRSAVLRAGGTDTLRSLARHEAGVTHQTRVEALDWVDGRLTATLTSDLVHLGKDGSRRPVRFVLDGERIRWDLPADVLAVPGAAAASDVTDVLGAASVRGLVRLRDDNTDLYVPTRHRAVSLPLGRNAAGLSTVALRLEASLAFDPAAADHGSPVTGLWDLSVLVEACGWSKARRVGEDRSPLADAGLRPAFGPDGTFSAPYWTKSGNLSVRVAPASLGALKGAVREPGRSWVRGAGDLVEVAVPVEVGPLHHPVPLTVSLAGESADPLDLPALIGPNGAPDLAVLTFAVPASAAGADPGASRTWRLRVRQEHRTSADADLGLTLSRHASGHWSVHRPAG
ncbi:glycosyltransferase family 2 protein [Streptomyces sp. NPDC001380]|uniref:glycosyltransferase family 2 protein n=1 Tax=Streptomyces sp. NPDC001380 TaxID=3364566 RepID=UPI0036B646A4